MHFIILNYENSDRDIKSLLNHWTPIEIYTCKKGVKIRGFHLIWAYPKCSRLVLGFTRKKNITLSDYFRVDFLDFQSILSYDPLDFPLIISTRGLRIFFFWKKSIIFCRKITQTMCLALYLRDPLVNGMHFK